MDNKLRELRQPAPISSCYDCPYVSTVSGHPQCYRDNFVGNKKGTYDIILSEKQRFATFCKLPIIMKDPEEAPRIKIPFQKGCLICEPYILRDLYHIGLHEAFDLLVKEHTTEKYSDETKFEHKGNCLCKLCVAMDCEVAKGNTYISTANAWEKHRANFGFTIQRYKHSDGNKL